ncbi:MAG: Archaeal ATPase [Actinobacteria bacterium ADurb.Bin346]|nr:MAG: Archaeal ATPase [Actinobacteria bacterium ADurb.Bin346]
MAKEYRRPVFNKILTRIREKRNFIQILTGPRQVGKTTLARQIINDYKSPIHYVSADEPTLRDRSWINQQWDIARLKITEVKKSDALLILDEVQKITGWSETVKRLWDEDTINKINLKVILLGSSPLLMQKGLTESLGGRFETIPVTHWSFAEMRDCFNIALEEYIYFGGYPGAMQLTGDTGRWKQYIMDSLIETTISRDILLMTRVDKPALLRQLFHLGCQYSGQVLSYQKMIGQLYDAGNTTTLAHYLELLNGAGLLSGLNKYSGKAHRKRGSSPKLLVLNTALMSALSSFSYKEAIYDRQYWGRLTETAVGAHLVNDSKGKDISVYYWLNRNREVDFVLESGKILVAIEIKSGKKRNTLEGMDEFCRIFKVKSRLLVGQQGITISEFLASPIEKWIK